MTRRIVIAAAMMFAGGLAWAADDPPAPQPKRGERAAQPKSAPAQPEPPLRFNDLPFRASTVARYEEEVESLEANLETRKAYLRAAEVGVKVPKLKFEQLTRLSTGANPVVSHTEVDLAKAELEAAEAQVPIRQAELKEVEVRLKHAKKRLADAKNPPPRPARPANPNANPFRRGDRPASRKSVDPQQ